MKQTSSSPSIGTRTLRLKFPCVIQQVDESTIQITAEVGPTPFTAEFDDYVHQQLGNAEGGLYLDGLVDQVTKDLVLKKVRLG